MNLRVEWARAPHIRPPYKADLHARPDRSRTSATGERRDGVRDEHALRRSKGGCQVSHAMLPSGASGGGCSLKAHLLCRARPCGPSHPEGKRRRLQVRHRSASQSAGYDRPSRRVRVDDARATARRLHSRHSQLPYDRAGRFRRRFRPATDPGIRSQSWPRSSRCVCVIRIRRCHDLKQLEFSFVQIYRFGPLARLSRSE